jgi:glutamate-ammonia-ligase adenylyltransferase
MTAVDAPRVRDAIDRSADPVLARASLERLIEAHSGLAEDLLADELLLDAVVAVSVASRSLFAALERDPVVVAVLRSEALQRDTDADAYRASASALLTAVDPTSALRHWKQAEITRIAGRDLLAIADLRTVARELAALADACLEVALELAAPEVPMAVIGMGKLGGAELNYASDVDVLFVHEGNGATDAAEHAARRILRIMSEPTADGIVFRTDADLRPEGRAGALSRSLAGYTAYWEKWARTWELQSLIKARAVAGDGELATAFIDRVPRFVWPDVLSPDAVSEVRSMKSRTEEMLRRKGVDNREVKRGTGGIRDIEFAVQLLQLVHGRHDPSVRQRSTLDALEALARGGYVTTNDARDLDDAYVWMRTVEHRLQLVDEHQTHTIPDADDARTHLARVLGFRDRLNVSAVEAFDAEHQRRRAQVRAIHEKLFFAPVLDTLAGVGPLPEAAAEERLAAFGFRDIAQTRAALNELAGGLTRRSRVMQQLLPAILEWLSEAPDPDLGLLQLRRLTEGYTRSSTIARRFRETPITARRTARILGSSRVLGLALHRQPDFVDALSDDDLLAKPVTRDQLVAEALDTLDWRDDESGRTAGLRRFKRRQLLRIGARDVLGFADIADVERDMSNLADATVEAALRSLEPDLPFAVIGLGRLGGCELSYASDLDLLFVYEGTSPTDFSRGERIAERLVAAIGATTTEGSAFRVDTRLRPEGKQGALARSLQGYRSYYERWGQTWEFQALTRARAVAGDTDLASAFIDLAHGFSYRDPFPVEWRREIRRMKARIERERVPAGEDPRFHLKLGRGSLSDVEFTVQLLQLEHGGTDTTVRDPSTLGALAALTERGDIARADADQLAAAYVLCERARSARYLLTGTPSDALPVDGDESVRLGRMLGYEERPSQSLREDYRRLTRRARAVVERVFYGRDDGGDS